MQDDSVYSQIQIALNEIYDKRRLVAICFAMISIAILAVGLKWPETYESSTTLLWDKSQVIKPLLEGTAITNPGSEQVQIAKEVIYSNRSLETLIQKAELNIKDSGRQMSDREVEILKSVLREKIVIEWGKNNILRISYKSSSPEEAYLVVSIVSKLFIEETTQNQKDESFKAYQFIQSQVDNYQAKLNRINQSISDFKASNLEIQVDTIQAVNNRISNLSQQIETTSLQLKEAKIQRDSLAEQLAIESVKTTAEGVVTVRNKRLADLESQLARLRLTYTETYPDVVQLKEQIEFIKQELAQGGAGLTEQIETAEDSRRRSARSELYNRLKQQIADQETTIKTLEARKADLEARFAQEISRSSDVNQVVSTLEELSRDQAVTKQLYDKLLIKLENARVSLNLELESAGSMFKVQEPPVIPLVPQGLRFLHFAIASLVFGLGIPIGAIIVLLQIDPRIRDTDSLDLKGGIQVIGRVGSFRNARELRAQTFATVQSVLIVILSLAAISCLSLMRYYEII